MEEKQVIGGQAVVEGVMMRDRDNYSIAVRKADGKIAVRKEKISSLASRYSFLKWPFFRGIVNMAETLVLGIKALSYSADMAASEDEKFSTKELAVTLILAVGMAVGLFIVLPFFLTTLISKSNGLIFNLIDGLLRLVIFFIYLLLISLIPEVRELFRYHGAEHKVINAFEHGEKLTVKNVQKYTTEHARCGTSFLLIVMVISILTFSLIVDNSKWIRILSRFILVPLIVGVSYELLKFSAKHTDNPIFKVLITPGLLIQRLTTGEPSEKQIEVSIAAAMALIEK